jgi:hypothetical protein
VSEKKFQVYLLGGLGNQLFGTFFAKALNIHFPNQVSISSRMIPFGSNPTRKLVVDQLDLARTESIEIVRTSSLADNLIAQSQIYRRIVWYLYKGMDYRERISMKDFWSSDFTDKVKELKFLDYFDDWFFPEYVLASRELNGNQAKISKNSFTENYIICHLRIGDYVKHPDIYALASKNYYLQAIDSIKEKSKMGKNVKIVLVSEDEREVEEHYPELFEIAEKCISRSSGLSDLDTFNLLVNAPNLIASNSTYSMWAAWFGKSSRPNTIVPSSSELLAIESGQLNLEWTIINQQTGEILDNMEYDDWYQRKKSGFDLAVRRLKSL